MITNRTMTMTTLQKILTTLLLTVMATIAAKADVTYDEISRLYYEERNGECTIYNENYNFPDPNNPYSGDVEIPATIGNSTVIAVGQNAFYASCITSIVIPNTVTEIATQAFFGSDNLTTVTIPSSVTTIDDYAFANCLSLTEINVESGNPNYVSVDGILYTKDMTTLMQCPCGKTGTVTIPSTVTTIANGAFEGCGTNNELTVIVPASVTSIGDLCFAWTSVAVTINATTPPTISSSSFSESSGTITVPAGSESAYEAVTEWNTAINGSDDDDEDVLLGDVNGDGTVNTTDAVIVINYYLGRTTEINFKAADVNGDSTINTTDAVAIINIYLNRK